jgi:transcriptional regulator with XRE-family HTH domain
MQTLLPAHGLSSGMGRPAKTPRSSIGQHLAHLREAAGLTQQQLAEATGVHQSNIAFWERSPKPPRGEVLPLLAQALGVSVDALLNVEPVKRKKQPGPEGRLQKLFDQVSKLPRRQQQKVIEMAEAFLALHQARAS